MSVDLATIWGRVAKELRKTDGNRGHPPYKGVSLLFTNFCHTPKLKGEFRKLQLVPDSTAEAVHPYIEACAVEMQLWEQMEKVEGAYVGIPGNIHLFDLLGGSFRNHIHWRLDLASDFFNSWRPNACRALFFEAIRGGLAKLRLVPDARYGSLGKIRGLDQPVSGEIYRNAALLVAVPDPAQFDISKLIKWLVGYEEHYWFNYTESAGEARTMKVDYCDKEEEVQLALLEDLGLARDSNVLASTHEELHRWCFNAKKYKQRLYQQYKRKCPVCALLRPGSPFIWQNIAGASTKSSRGKREEVQNPGHGVVVRWRKFSN